MADLKALANLIGREFPDLAADRTVEAMTEAAARAEAEAIVAAGTGGRLSDSGPTLGATAIAIATEYVARPAGEHVTDGVAHHVFNSLSTPRATQAVDRIIGRDKLVILNAVPSLLDAEIQWRSRAASDAGLATTLVYWDRATMINPADPLSQKILGMLETAGISTPAMRAAIVAACTVSETAMETPLATAGLEDATVEDVRAIVAVG